MCFSPTWYQYVAGFLIGPVGAVLGLLLLAYLLRRVYLAAEEGLRRVGWKAPPPKLVDAVGAGCATAVIGGCTCFILWGSTLTATMLAFSPDYYGECARRCEAAGLELIRNRALTYTDNGTVTCPCMVQESLTIPCDLIEPAAP